MPGDSVPLQEPVYIRSAPIISEREPFILKVGDTLPPLIESLWGIEADHPNLTNATVKFIYRKLVDGAASVVRDAVVEDAASNQVRYNWVSGDTNAEGEFRYEWQVTYDDGKKLTFPRERIRRFRVIADLGG